MKTVYLDNASNTQVDEEVFRAMKPYLTGGFVGNSHSSHDYGYEALKIINDSRTLIGASLGVIAKNVLFTSGATESNNFVIKALAMRELSKRPVKEQKKHIVCGATEHASVLNPLNQLKSMGFKITYINPDKNGIVRAEDVIKAFTDKTFLVCLMDINNELGTQNEVTPVAAEARKRGIFSLIDCTQSFSYGGDSINLREKFPEGDFFSFSTHKLYGPTGIGGLICLRNQFELLNGYALISGGSQEGSLRGGTSNLYGIVGTNAAITYLFHNDLSELYNNLYDYLLSSLNDRIGENNYRLNAIPAHKNIVNIDFSNYIKVDSLAISLSMYGVAVSAGSACDADHDETQGDFNPSHVLLSIGLDEEQIRNSIRISFSKYTTKKDIDFFIEQLINLHNDLCIE